MFRIYFCRKIHTGKNLKTSRVKSRASWNASPLCHSMPVDLLRYTNVCFNCHVTVCVCVCDLRKTNTSHYTTKQAGNFVVVVSIIINRTHSTAGQFMYKTAWGDAVREILANAPPPPTSAFRKILHSIYCKRYVSHSVSVQLQGRNQPSSWGEAEEILTPKRLF